MLTDRERAHARWHSRTLVSVGNHVGCAVLSDGMVAWWGYEGGATRPPPKCVAERRAVQVSCGHSHVVAVLSDGSVVGWGISIQGEAPTDPTFLNRKKAVCVAAGCGFSLAVLEDGSVVGWGENSSGQAQPPVLGGPGGRQAVGISAGYAHGLAVLDDGSIIGWGSNTDFFGEKQHNQAIPPPQPVDGRRAVAVAAGGFHSVALYNDGSVICWGCDDDGQCTAADATNGRRVVCISAGLVHTLALTSTGAITAWGRGGPNSKPLTGAPATWSWLPDLGLEGFSSIGGGGREYGRQPAAAIAAGNMFNVAALVDGTIVSWGDDTDGRAQPPPPSVLGKRGVPVQPLPN